MTVRIDPRSIQPDVIVPHYLPTPERVNICLLFQSQPWNWRGDNVALIRHPWHATSPKLVKEALNWLELAHDQHGIRPLNAAEMDQIMQNTSCDIPEHWHEQGFGGRIFSAGSIYRLVYPDESMRDVISYCWYEEGEWRRAFVEEDAPLRPADEFAVVPKRDGDLIPGGVAEKPVAFSRKRRYRPRFRRF